jgi:hypothetical protein
MHKALFYAQDSRRQGSTEIDFGVWWFEGDPFAFGRDQYRVSWIERTGEFYAFNQQQNTIELLGHAATEQEADALLEGWASVCGKPASLPWVRAALAETTH